MNRRPAHTLVELMIVVVIVGAFAVIAVPRLQFGAVRIKEADAAARKLVTDLRRTRSMALRDAASNSKGFELKMTKGGLLGLLGEYSGYEIENMDTKVTVDSFSFSSNVSVNCPGGHEFRFQPLGNLQTGGLDDGTQITVSANGKTFTITITASTGSVQCAGS